MRISDSRTAELLSIPHITDHVPVNNSFIGAASMGTSLP